MNRYRKNRLFANSALLIALTSLSVTDPVRANEPMDCYSSADDFDGDGYATKNAVAWSVARANDLYCPGAWVEKAGDCDDHNAWVHPRNHEYGGNGIDDNCADGADEPIPYYSGEGFDVTTSSFSMVLQLNDADMVYLQNMGLPLQAVVWVESLKNSNAWYTMTVPATFHQPGFVKVNIGGLESSTAYRVSAYLSTCFFACQSTAWSPYYYSTTTGRSAISKARTSIVLSALNQYKDSNYQQVGYGYALPGLSGRRADGTRYGASYGEKWCSEFYSWVGIAYLKWPSDPPDNIDAMLRAFNHYSNVLPVSQAPSSAARGDYLALDTDGDNAKNHSAMVLAWDASIGKFWTVEGNSGGNEVQVGTVDPATVKAFGHITSSMIR